jgi:hypothetical protein
MVYARASTKKDLESPITLPEKFGQSSSQVKSPPGTTKICVYDNSSEIEHFVV